MMEICEYDYYLIKAQYFGVGYFGHQNQMQDCWPTIQSELMKALIKISPQLTPTTCKIQSCSRTDAGVHALAQFSIIPVRKTFPKNKLLCALNFHLPNTIRIVECNHYENRPSDIRSLFSWKEYRYYFYLSQNPHPLFLNQMCHMPYSLDFELMHKAAQMLVGTHDFKNFQCAGTIVTSTIRTILHLSIIPMPQVPMTFFPFPQDTFILQVIGTGFLKQMIRLIMGTLWAVGRKKLSIEELQFALENPSDQKLGIVAPPQALYLYNVGIHGQNWQNFII